MPSDGIDGNLPSCTGKSGKEKVPKPAKEPQNREKLVRIGSRYFIYFGLQGPKGDNGDVGAKGITVRREGKGFVELRVHKVQVVCRD